MILTPQETAIMRGRPHDKIMQGIQTAITLKQYSPLEGSDGSVIAILEGDNVPAFTIPTQIHDVMGNVFYCIDLRKANREYLINETTGGYSPKLLTEANFLTNLALTQKAWINDISLFNPIYWDMCQVYAMWIGMKISKRLLLTPTQQTELVCQFAYYFATQPYRGATLNDMDYRLIANRLATLLRYNPSEVDLFLKPFNKRLFSGLDEFCEVIANVTDNPKMKKFNRIVVQTLLIGSWFGQNARELIAIASEFPPMFMAMVYRSLNERSFKDTDITQVVLRTFNTVKQKQLNLVYADILKRTAG